MLFIIQVNYFTVRLCFTLCCIKSHHTWLHKSFLCQSCVNFVFSFLILTKSDRSDKLVMQTITYAWRKDLCIFAVGLKHKSVSVSCSSGSSFTCSCCDCGSHQEKEISIVYPLLRFLLWEVFLRSANIHIDQYTEKINLKNT